MSRTIGLTEPPSRVTTRALVLGIGSSLRVQAIGVSVHGKASRTVLTKSSRDARKGVRSQRPAWVAMSSSHR